MLLLSVIACADPAPAPAGEGVALMSIEDRLLRVSMAVRGVAPTPADRDRIADAPASLPDLVDEWLASDPFVETIKDLHAETFRVRVDVKTLLQFPTLGPLAGRSSSDLQDSLMDEPLELVAAIVAEDRPYTEIVTADHAMSDEALSLIYGLDWSPDGPEWQRSRYPDGRPHAGVLSSSWLWIQHHSGLTNFSRRRAAMVADSLVCDDIENRDVDVDDAVDLTDPVEVADTVISNPACLSCHQVLEPIASNFWGFKRRMVGSNIRDAMNQGCRGPGVDSGPTEGHPVSDYCYPIQFYTPSREDSWMEWGLEPPGYYGSPTSGLADLGQQIAADPRFDQCTVDRFYAWFHQVDRGEVPEDQRAALLQTYLAGGRSAKALVKAIVLSDGFLGAAAPPLQTRPEQLARNLEHTLGFRWTAEPDDVERCGDLCWGEVDLMRSDLYGFRTLAGGIDGLVVDRPNYRPTISRALVVEALAVDAALSVVVADLSGEGPPRLLDQIGPSDTDETGVRSQIAAVQSRLTAHTPDPAEVDATHDLWRSVHERTGDPLRAWVVTVSALLQHPRIQWH